MVMAVSTLIFGLFYLFFYQPAQLLKEASASSSSDDESKLQTKKMKIAKKNKKGKSGKTKESRPPGEGLDLEVTLDKTGKKAVKTNRVHPWWPAVGCSVQSNNHNCMNTEKSVNKDKPLQLLACVSFG